MLPALGAPPDRRADRIEGPRESDQGDNPLRSCGAASSTRHTNANGTAHVDLCLASGTYHVGPANQMNAAWRDLRYANGFRAKRSGFHAEPFNYPRSPTTPIVISPSTILSVH